MVQQTFEDNSTMQTQEANQYSNGDEVFFILQSQQLILAQKTPPKNFYVKGIIENNSFKPTSEVLGAGTLASNGDYGWLEIKSKQFHPMESARTAITPFIKGYMTKAGFIPSEREVFDTP